MEKFVLNDRVAQHLRAEIVMVGQGHAKTKLKIREDFLNGLDVAHGGIIFTLVTMLLPWRQTIRKNQAWPSMPTSILSNPPCWGMRSQPRSKKSPAAGGWARTRV